MDLFSSQSQLQTFAPEFTVSDFLDRINTIIGQEEYVIKGEVTSVDVRGTNCFFSISDKENTSVLNCYAYINVLWNSGVELVVGQAIKILGKPSIYKKAGKFSFTVKNIYLEGEGELIAAFEKLKLELEKLGYFENARKRQIPAFPNVIGLLTSVSGAAKSDFLTHLIPVGIKVYFCDVKVEGMHAEESIINGIKYFNESGLDPEVLVLIRGGGSIESLQVFNSQNIAKAIYGSKIPILTGIGHEKDTTIADLVADCRASTPTHAAKILSENWVKAGEEVNHFESSIASNFKNSIQIYKKFLKDYQNSYQINFKNHLTTDMRFLNTVEKNILFTIRRSLDHGRQKVESQFMTNLTSFKFNLQKIQSEISSREQLLSSHDPFKIMQKGYSIITNSKGKVVKSSEDVSLDEQIDTVLSEGTLKSIIIQKNNGKS